MNDLSYGTATQTRAKGLQCFFGDARVRKTSVLAGVVRGRKFSPAAHFVKVENFRLRRISLKTVRRLGNIFFSQKTAPYSARFENSGRLAAPDSDFFFGAGDVRGRKYFFGAGDVGVENIFFELTGPTSPKKKALERGPLTGPLSVAGEKNT